MKRNLLSISLLFATLMSANSALIAQERSQITQSATSVAATPDPAKQIQETALMLRRNDLAGLALALIPPAQFQHIREAYEVKRLEPTTAVERAEFAEGLAKLTAADAVDQLMQEIEPKLQEARPQAAGAIMMGLGALQVAIASPQAELSTEQRAALQSALPGIQQWLGATDFLSSVSMRQALTLVTDAARNAGVNNLDQLKMLSFEEVLARAGTVFAAGKQALRIYGLDLDAIAATTRVQVLEIDGATARIRATVTIFDAPVSSEHELVLVEGRWYGKKTLAHWTTHHERHSKS